MKRTHCSTLQENQEICFDTFICLLCTTNATIDILKKQGLGGKGARGVREGNRGPRNWWVCPSSENPIYVYSLHPPFVPLPECSQMSSRCSPELRCDTLYSSKKLLRSMHIHIHVSMLVCCNASAAWVVVKTQLSSGSDSTQSRIVEPSCC